MVENYSERERRHMTVSFCRWALRRNHSDTSRLEIIVMLAIFVGAVVAIGVGVGLSISDAYDGMEQEKTDNSLFWSRYNAELVEKYVR